MDVQQGIFSEGAIAQMSQVKFPDKVDVVLQPVYITKPLRIPFGNLLDLFMEG
jgi:hypothetical protein